MNKRYRYSVGTLETGGFVSFTNLKEAKAEAKDWANESTEEVMVWACWERAASATSSTRSRATPGS